MTIHVTPNELPFVVLQCTSKTGGPLEVVGIFGETFRVNMDPGGVSNIHFTRVVSGPPDLELLSSKSVSEYHAGITAPVIAKAEPIEFPVQASKEEVVAGPTKALAKPDPVKVEAPDKE